MEIICGIYKITSPTGKVYIGQSINIKRRLNSYKGLRCKEQSIIYRSILKYGWSNHKVDIIHVCKRNELNNFEKYYVDLFNSFNSKYGMNLLDGGGSRATCSDETKLKMRNSRIGKKHTEESKKKMSDIQKKIIKSKEWCDNISKGKQNISEETRRKIGLSSIGRKANLGNKHSSETKLKIGNANRGRKINGREIININTGVVYWCKKEAAESCNLKTRTLKAKLLGYIKNNTPFRYYDEYQKLLGHSNIKITELYAKVSTNLISQVKSPLSNIEL